LLPGWGVFEGGRWVISGEGGHCRGGVLFLTLILHPADYRLLHYWFEDARDKHCEREKIFQ